MQFVSPLAGFSFARLRPLDTPVLSRYQQSAPHFHRARSAKAHCPGFQPDSPQSVVVVGLGYVGLPLVAAAVDAGLSVTGLDKDADRVDRLNSGDSYIDDLSDKELTQLLDRGFRGTTDSSC